MVRRVSHSSTPIRHQRDAFPPSLDALLGPPIRLTPLHDLLSLATPLPATVVREAGDRRQFRPDEATRPPHAVRPGASRVVAHPARFAATRFSDPRAVSICARRSIRKEVLFALRLTRKGSGSRKRRDFWSNVSCR